MVMEHLRSAYQHRWRGRVVALDQTSRRRYFVPALKGGPHGEEALLRRLEPWDQTLRILRDARKSAPQDEENRSAAHAYRLPATGRWLPRPFGEMCSPIMSGSAISAEKSCGSKNSFGSACTA